MCQKNLRANNFIRFDIESTQFLYTTTITTVSKYHQQINQTHIEHWALEVAHRWGLNNAIVL